MLKIAAARRTVLSRAPHSPLRLCAAARTHCTIFPSFTLVDYAKAKPFMDKCINLTRVLRLDEEGVVYYGWTVSEDKTKLHCRETYIDGKAAAAHFINVGPTIGEMLGSGAIKLDDIGVMGTVEELADVKEEADKLGCSYWEVWDSFVNFKHQPSVLVSDDKLCTVTPTFTILDLAKAEPFMKQCVESTRSEAGCVFYGFTIDKASGKLFCREGYVDGKAVNAHFEAAVPLVGAMIESGAVTLDHLYVHGPRSEWPYFQEAGAGVGPKYFDVDGSFSKFTM